MTIKEFLSTKNIVSTIAIPIGLASTPQELYDECITVAYPSDASNPQTDKITQAIIGWHKLLSWYAEQEGAVLLSRLYESEGTSGNWDNRRNSLTISENYSYAFCSNHFARVIMTMALSGFVPDKKDFWDMMVNERGFYLGSLFGLTPVEKRISAYSQKVYNAKFYTPGWYLAHIISVAAKEMQYKEHQDIDVKNIFKLGREIDWQSDSMLGCKIRRNKDCLDAREKKVAIAHFLRCLDPINYFLVPNQNNTIYKKINAGDGSPLGENKFVVQFMFTKAHERFGSHFEDFLRKALVDFDIKSIYEKKSSIASAAIQAEYAPGINATGDSRKYSEDEEFEVAAYFLKNRVGLVNVEEIVLKVSSKRGWAAKEILNKLGIDTSKKSPHRGLLAKSNIDDEIAKATGVFKNTLEEIKKRGL